MDSKILNVARKFDHTNLSIDCKTEDILTLCDEALSYNFYSVMVYPNFVPECKMVLDGSNVLVGTVIGFPHGKSDVLVKQREIEIAIDHGVDEVDVVLDRYGLSQDDFIEQAEYEIETLTNLCKENKVIIKFIVETCYLSTPQKIKALELCEKFDVNYIKTSTGFGKAGATLEDVQLFHSNRKGGIGIKASGGIKTLKIAASMIKAGADRIGSSSSVQILQELIYKQENPSNVIEFTGNNG